VTLCGQDITGLPPYAICDRGIALVPQGRRIFPSLDVIEHLTLVCGLAGRGRSSVSFDLFPRLAERRRQRARTLSAASSRCSRSRGPSCSIRPCS